MTKQTNTTGMEFCETCGTMLLMGICRRCTPDIKPISAINAAQPVKKPRVNTWVVHDAGVDAAIGNLVDNGIPVGIGPGHGEDIILPNGATILVRAYSKNVARAFLIRNDLGDLKTDYLIIVTNLESAHDMGTHIIPIQHAKDIADNSPDPKTGSDNFFINIDECEEYADNYGVIRDV